MKEHSKGEKKRPEENTPIKNKGKIRHKNTFKGTTKGSQNITSKANNINHQSVVTGLVMIFYSSHVSENVSLNTHSKAIPIFIPLE